MVEDDDAELVASVAGEFVGKLGKGAVPHLRRKGALATGEGDDLSAGAWHDIADAAALILTRVNCSSSRCTKLRDPRAPLASLRLS